MARICNHCIKNFRLNFSDSPSPPCTSSFAPNRIIIAAKNPEPEEIKYEMADFLYHAMVMMVEKGITWDEIIEELDNRH